MSDDTAKNGLAIKLLGPAAEAAGATLKGVWETVFGKIDLYTAKQSLIRAKALDDFKATLEQKVLDIPPEALQEPRLSILGPTIEASKYYFEEAPLRDMFASLAAASMDRRKEHDLHPSYPEIIKQMSPLDAVNLLHFRHQNPVAEYFIKYEKYIVTVLPHVFLENQEETDLEQQARSLTSLSRLGLILIDYGEYMLESKYYEKFFATEYFLRLSATLPAAAKMAGVNPGRARATPLGRSFISVCSTY